MKQLGLPSVQSSACGGEHDHWPTPDWATGALVDVLPDSPGGWVLLEPASGIGAIITSLSSRVEVVAAFAAEIDESRYLALTQDLPSVHAYHCDFLADGDHVVDAWKAACAGYPKARPLICGNPPYSKPRDGIGVDFVVRCLEIASEMPDAVVAQLLPLDFACGVDRSERIHDRFPSSLYPFRRRPSFNGEGSGKRPFCWFTWNFQAGATPTWKVIG